MKQWCIRSFAALALVALLALLLPAPAWACPVTGRVGSAATVCRDMMPASIGAHGAVSQPCAHAGGKCCKPVSLPPLPGKSSDDEKHPAAAVAVAPPVALSFLLAYTPTVEIAFVLPAQPSFPAAPQAWLARLNNSPPSFLLQHRPASIAGRAPPTL